MLFPRTLKEFRKLKTCIKVGELLNLQIDDLVSTCSTLNNSPYQINLLTDKGPDQVLSYLVQIALSADSTHEYVPLPPRHYARLG